jgi:long-chain fatty acid transport protein
MRKALVLLLVLLLSPAARATGGIQIEEQSAPATGMAGAYTAVANDPSAIFYNPAGLGFQRGFGALLGGEIIVTRTHVSPDDLTLWHPSVAPNFYVAQRFGRHIAIGLGGFANFGEHFDYPPNWRGRFEGFFIDVVTYTFNPTIAVRLLPGLSLGVGLDVTPGSVDLYRGVQFGGGEGSVHVGANGVAVGGNVGLLLELVPHHFRFGVAYRSRADLDISGHGAVSAPPELRDLTGGLQTARATLPLPHNFSIGMAGFIGHLTLSGDLKVTIWRDLDTLTVKLTNPTAPPGTAPTLDELVLNLHNTWALRFGGQYGFLGDKLRVRLGAGYDTTPLPRSRLGPLLPDTDRGLVSAGVGLHWHWLDLDLAYMAVFLIKQTSTDPNLRATYESFGQVISASATIRFPNWLQHAPAPAYEAGE